jgi:hypothetical protein
MLASITPLGERGRHSHWSVTVTAFLLGALGAGALLGAALGLAGFTLLDGVSPIARLVALAVALLAAVGLDAGPWRVPGPRRQVDERWLDRYRGWVYGLGYGAQMGAGTATVVTSAATYVALLAAFESAAPAGGAVIVGVYGAIRGLTPLAGAWVRTSQQLIAFHAGLDRARAGAARAGTTVLAAAVALVVIALAS